MKKTHNGIISFWKFIFSIIILLYHFQFRIHSRYFKMGYLGVDFFFIVSGYLMTAGALKKSNNPNESIGKITWEYIWKKVKVLFPYIFLAFMISLFVKSSFRTFESYQYARSVWNLFLIDMSGVITTQMLGQSWYISAMLISMIILFPLIRKYQKNFIYYAVH